MSTLQEIIAAKKLAQAKAQANAAATAPAPAPDTTANPTANTTHVPNTSTVVQGTAVVAGQDKAEAPTEPVTVAPTEPVTVTPMAVRKEPEKDAEPVSTPSNPPTTAEPAPSEAPQEPPQFAKNLADELKAMAQEQDWLDVEQSANSLNEILSVIFDLPYPPDVFIDECIDNAACALEAQKNRYLHDVLNGKKQSGKRVKASAGMSPLQQAVALDKLDDDDIFVFDPLDSVGG
jgi:hypothetical protein